MDYIISSASLTQGECLQMLYEPLEKCFPIAILFYNIRPLLEMP